MSFSLWAMACRGIAVLPPKSPIRARTRIGPDASCNPRTNLALRLHSCRALSSRPRRKWNTTHPQLAT